MLTSSEFLHSLDQYLSSIGHACAAPDSRGVVTIRSRACTLATQLLPQGEVELLASLGRVNARLHGLAEESGPRFASLTRLASWRDDDARWVLSVRCGDGLLVLTCSTAMPQAQSQWAIAIQAFEQARRQCIDSMAC